MVKRIICWMVFFCCVQASVTAQINPYAIQKNGPCFINASIVKRSENILFQVSAIDKATLSVKQVKTILNDKGNTALLFNQYANRFMQLGNVEIKVFDSTGKQKARYKKSDMQTVAYGNGLVDDGQVTYFSIPQVAYPMTISVEYNYNYKGTLIYPSYNIIDAEESVEESSFTAKVPAELGLRYKNNNTDCRPDTSTIDRYKIYHWKINSLPAIKNEAGSVSKEFRYPSILLAPNRFRLYGYEGDMTSWKNFSQWEYELTKDLYNLPPATIDFYKTMTSNTSTDKEKINIVYRYLQNNFRYVSIQLGIGGFKPFDAAFTDQKKYGDCKGLSFYMHAVLKALSIESYLALINAGDNKLPADPDFPCNQFNHMILCVPGKSDTTWLECTSKNNAPGFLGSFTENRNALLIKPNDGALVNTTTAKANDNLFTSVSTVTLSADKSAKSNTTILSTGNLKETLLQNLTDSKKNDQARYLVDVLGFKQPDDLSISKKIVDDMLITTIESSNEQMPLFTAGNKWFLRSGTGSLWNVSLPAANDRLQDYFFETPFVKTDTTIYKLPVDFIVDFLPGNKQLHNVYADIISKYWFDEKAHAVYSTSQLTLRQHRIPATAYAGIKAFVDDVIKTGEQQIVIRKKQ